MTETTTTRSVGSFPDLAFQQRALLVLVFLGSMFTTIGVGLTDPFYLRFTGLLVLLYALLSDFQRREVDNWVWGVLFTLGLTTLALEPLAVLTELTIALTLSMAFVAMTWPRGIGGADAKAILVIPFLLPVGLVWPFLIAAGFVLGILSTRLILRIPLQESPLMVGLGISYLLGLLAI